MGTLNSWDIVDANNNATPPDGWPENTMQYSEVNDTGRAVQGTLKRYFADINGSLVAGGVADAYTVSLNETGYTSYFTGMYFACEINSDNTGASTIDVNGIGAQNIVTPDGSALGADTLKSGGIYEFRYDGTNFQLGGSVGGSSVTVNQIVLSNTNDPDLVDTDVALNVGTDDPDNNQHVEVGPSDIQSKSDATTVAALGINALGGDVSICDAGGNVDIGAQTGTGNVTLYASGDISMISNDAGILMYGNALTATPPTTETVTCRLQFFDADGSDELAYFGFPASNDFLLVNRMHGGTINIRAEDSGGNEDVLFFGDPDGAVDLYHAGTRQFGTQSSGISVYGSTALSTPPTGAASTLITLWDSDGTDVIGSIGYAVSTNLTLSNDIHGGGIVMQAENNAGTNVNLITADPDADAIFYYAGALVAATLPAANGGLQVANTLTGGGLERVLTTSDASGTTFSGCTVSRADALYSAPVGVFAIPFVSEEFDDANWHDNVTNNTRLTVPAGISRVQLSGGVRTATGDQHTGKLYIAKNGSRNYDGIGFELNTTAIGGVLTGGIGCVTAWLAVTPGDYFELQFDNDEASAVNLDDNFTWFSVIGY